MPATTAGCVNVGELDLYVERHGDGAPLVRPEHAVDMFRLLGGGVVGDLGVMPRSQLSVLPGTSHVGMLERVEWLSAMILEFVAGSPG